MSSEARKVVRGKLLGQKLKKAVIELEDGVTVEVRQMSIGQMLDTVNETDMRKRMSRYLIDCCYIPGTDERIFEEADLDVLMELPVGGYYQKLMDTINSQLLPAQVEEAGKV